MLVPFFVVQCIVVTDKNQTLGRKIYETFRAIGRYDQVFNGTTT